MRLIQWLSAFMLLCALALMATAPAHAFGLSGFGGKLGYLRAEDLGGTATFGGHLEFERSGSRFHLQPSVMYWKEDGISDLSVNGDVYYHFASEGQVTPYLGAGLGANIFDNEFTDQSDTELGANLFGGMRMPALGNHYFFMEARLTASEIGQFSVLGGMTFRQ
jgi:hypothetical protein